MTQHPAQHWAAAYVGRCDLNCWQLVKAIYSDRFAIDLPDIEADSLRAGIAAFAAHEETRNGHPVDVPAEGDAVLMRQCRYPSHVGVVLGGEEDDPRPRIIHAVEGMGAVLHDMASITAHGFRITGFLRHAAMMEARP